MYTVNSYNVAAFYTLGKGGGSRLNTILSRLIADGIPGTIGWGALDGDTLDTQDNNDVFHIRVGCKDYPDLSLEASKLAVNVLPGGPIWEIPNTRQFWMVHPREIILWNTIKNRGDSRIPKTEYKFCYVLTAVHCHWYCLVREASQDIVKEWGLK